MTRNIIALIGLVLLAGCSGGGGDPSTTSSAPPPATPTAQPDMLTATNQGLLRGKANGQGQQLIISRTNFRVATVSDGHVIYVRPKSEFDDDIWAVKLDGTGDRALVNTQEDEGIRDVKGPWLLYSNRNQQIWSVRLDTGAQFLIHDNEGLGTTAQFYGTDRVMMGMDHELFSNTVTGGNRLSYIFKRDGDTMLYVMHTTEHALIYGREVIGETNPETLKLFTVPLAGGASTMLDDTQLRTHFGAAIGERIVYHRCTPAFACDVVSIDSDGTDRVALTSHPAHEIVQGVTTDQVIIRRNLAGNDHLIAVPVTGGAERLLMTMTDSEFVDLIIGDLLIVRRSSGTWSLDLSGTLNQLDSRAGLDGFVAVGNAICSTNPVWCMPFDGSGQAVKIADEGKVVGVL